MPDFNYLNKILKGYKWMLVGFLLFLSFDSFSQDTIPFKQRKHKIFEITTGAQVTGNLELLNRNLNANNFSSFHAPKSLFGFTYSYTNKRHIIRFRFASTAIFADKNNTSPVLGTTSISLTYGHDLLTKTERSFFYPFFGYNAESYRLSERSAAKGLNATNSNLGLITGFGFNGFLKKPALGFITNVDLNTGIIINVFNGKWKNEGASYLMGAKIVQPLYHFTTSIGF